VRLIQKWLSAGVMEDGQWAESESGTPQGATVSPLLANIYLHYVLDLWAQRWRRRQARGDVIITRYADDFIVGFQLRGDAERFLGDLRAQLGTVSLELHPVKTRLIEFGRFAAVNRRSRALGKPETFDFLGFTHLCGLTKKKKFLLSRRTIAKRRRAKLQEIKQSLRLRWHDSVDETGAWLHRLLTGYYRYFAVPTNLDMLDTFRSEVTKLWHHALRRRSQKSRVTWERMAVLAERWLPRPRTLHPLPGVRFDAKTQGRSPVR